LGPPRWLKDELLDGEIFYSLHEAHIIIETRRRHPNTVRPHATVGYWPLALEVFVPAFGSAACTTPIDSA